MPCAASARFERQRARASRTKTGTDRRIEHDERDVERGSSLGARVRRRIVEKDLRCDVVAAVELARRRRDELDDRARELEEVELKLGRLEHDCRIGELEAAQVGLLCAPSKRHRFRNDELGLLRIRRVERRQQHVRLLLHDFKHNHVAARQRRATKRENRRVIATRAVNACAQAFAMRTAARHYKCLAAPEYSSKPARWLGANVTGGGVGAAVMPALPSQMSEKYCFAAE